MKPYALPAASAQGPHIDKLRRPRIEFVTPVPGSVASVRTGDSIVVFGQNFSPDPSANKIVVANLGTPLLPPPAAGAVVAQISVAKADPRKLVSSPIPDVTPAQYLVWVEAQGQYSNAIAADFVGLELSHVWGAVTRPPPPPNPTPKPAYTFGPWGNTLRPGMTLLPTECLISNNGRWKLDFRAEDGNLVLYNTFTKGARWDIGTANYLAGRIPDPAYPLSHQPARFDLLVDLIVLHYLVMREDGKLVMVQGVRDTWDTCSHDEDAIQWTSDNPEAPGACFRIEDCGNLCIYDEGSPDCVIWRHGVT